MSEEMAVGCARPTGGLVGEGTAEKPTEENTAPKKEVATMIHVGKKAPDFGAPGYQKGKFISTKLSDRFIERGPAIGRPCPDFLLTNHIAASID